DPLSAPIVAQVGFMNYLARRYDEAIEACKKALEIDSTFSGSYHFMAFAYQAKGELSEAIEWLEKAAKVMPMNFGPRGWIYGLAGRRDDALRMLDSLKELSGRQYLSPWQFMTIYTGTRDVAAWRKALR